MATTNRSTKPQQKTAVSPLSGGRIPLGAHPGNTGGKKGRSGRKPVAFVEECERLTDAIALPKIAQYLRTAKPDDPAWRWCVEYVSKYTKSEAPKKVAHSGDAENPVRFTLTIGNGTALNGVHT